MKFWQPRGTFFPKRLKVFSSMSDKAKKITQFFKFFFSNWSYGHDKGSFDNPDIFFWEKPNFFCSMSENDENHTLFSWKEYFLSKRSCGNVECSFQNPLKVVSTKGQNFLCSMSREGLKTDFFQFFPQRGTLDA